jgi:hypothetical protein
MKKIQVLFIALSLAFVATACHSGRRTTIETSDDNHSSKIEYAGKIVFSTDSMGIASMSPGSYFKYKRNGQKLSAQNDSKGRIIYEMNDGHKSTQLNQEGRELISEAIREITQLRGKHS